MKSSRLLGIRIYLERHFNKTKYQQMFEDEDIPELFRERSELNELFLYSFPNRKIIIFMRVNLETEDVDNWPNSEFEYYKTITYSSPEKQNSFNKFYSMFINEIRVKLCNFNLRYYLQ